MMLGVVVLINNYMLARLIADMQIYLSIAFIGPDVCQPVMYQYVNQNSFTISNDST